MSDFSEFETRAGIVEAVAKYRSAIADTRSRMDVLAAKRPPSEGDMIQNNKFWSEYCLRLLGAYEQAMLMVANNLNTLLPKVDDEAR